MSHPLKIDRNCRGWSGRRFLKTSTSRARRRAARRDPENAGTKLKDFVKGWAS